MVFGRKGLPDPQLEMQRQHLTRTEQQLVMLEQGLGRLESYKAGTFSDVWFDSAEVAEAAVKAREARRLFDTIRARLVTTSSSVVGADSELALIDHSVEAGLLALDSFSAVLVGRLHLWNDEDRNPALAFDPSVRESQQALHGSATRLAAAVQEHINELRPLQDLHREYWPKNLNLPHLQQYLDEGCRMLKAFEEQFDSQSGPLPPKSSIELLLLAQRMENGVEMIENERTNLALEITMRAGLKNSGLS